MTQCLTVGRNVSHCDLYLHGTAILLYIIEELVWHMHMFPEYEMVWHNLSTQYWLVSHCDLYFMVQWFCFTSGNKPFDIFKCIFPDFRNSMGTYLWPQFQCKSLWPKDQGPVILPYIWKIIFHLNSILPWHYKILWHNVWPQYEYRVGRTYILWNTVILLYLWKTIRHTNIKFPDSWNGITQSFDLRKSSVGNFHQCLMVQWFCFIGLKDHLTYENHTSRLSNGVTRYLTSVWL